MTLDNSNKLAKLINFSLISLRVMARGVKEDKAILS